jgi:DinB superfamily
MLETYLELLDLCYFEVTEAFKGLADENVWKRPAPGLLSVGELAGHIAYGEVVRFAGENADGSCEIDLSNCKISSPLLDPRFRYYPTTLESADSEVQLAMSAAQVLAELERAHAEAMVCLRALNPDLAARAPHWGGSYKELLKYLIFHISYHTGQMYSVRHLLGEETPDN